MTQVNDPIRTGAAGTATDSSGRRFPSDRLLTQFGANPTLPRYNYAYGGIQVQPFTYWDNGGVAPVTLATNNIVASQAVSSGGNASINGALASGGVATLDIARGLQIVSSSASDSTQTATFTGTDVDGVALTQTVTFNGSTPVKTKKTFKTVTQVTISAALVGNVIVGTTDVFGLPWSALGRRQVLTCWGAPPADVTVTTGTFVAADTTSPATATTGDVRGTWTPADASDGTKMLAFWIAMNQSEADNVTSAIGVAQV